MSISSPNLAPALGPSGSETPPQAFVPSQPAAISPIPSPASGTRGGPASSSLEQVLGAGRYRRAPGKGLWQVNLTARRVSALPGQFLHCTESFFPWYVKRLGCRMATKSPPNLCSKQPCASQSCSPSPTPRNAKSAANPSSLPLPHPHCQLSL